MKSLKILISPLNWGLGHAGRMIPLAAELQKRGHEVIFGSDSSLVSLIQKALPDIKIIEIPGIKMKYSRILPQYLNILLRLPLLIYASVREHVILKGICSDLQPDIIISDNRFGFHHKRIFSVYVTHMLRIPFPRPFRFLEPAGMLVHKWVIMKYDLCLVPDYPGEPSVSGRLSHGIRVPDNVLYCGPLSRFSKNTSNSDPTESREPYTCLILSGPEPQRTRLLKKVISAIPGKKLVVLTQELPADDDLKDARITYIVNPDSQTMQDYIRKSEAVVCRSGYSLLMELISLGKGAVLIPTPGQTEQEYLSDYLNGRNGFVALKQNQTDNLRFILDNLTATNNITYPDNTPFFEEALSRLTHKQEQG